MTASPTGRGLPPGFEPPAEWEQRTTPEELGAERRRWCPTCWLCRLVRWLFRL